MSTVRRRRLAATALAMTAALTLGACGTGPGAQTNQVYQPAVGANHRGDVDIFNTLLVANEDGSATLSASVVSNGDDTQDLSSVTATTMDGKELETSGTEITLQRGVLTILDGSSEAGGFVVTSGAPAGEYVKVTFTFSDAAPVTVEAPVVARSAEYDSVAEPTTESSKAEVNDTAKEGAEGVDE